LKVLADGGKVVNMNASEFALMRSQQRKSVIFEEVKKRTVFHEVGHAIVAIHNFLSLLSTTIIHRECHRRLDYKKEKKITKLPGLIRQ
jgi:ATP-dependent Zn protease